MGTVVVANVVAFALYRKAHPVGPAAVASVEAPARPPPATEGSTARAAPPADLGLARAHRVAGLAALEDGDYSGAVKEFTQALRLGEDTGDTPELLRIAKELQERKRSNDQAEARANAASPPPAPAPAPPAPRPSSVRPKPAPARAAPAPAPEPKPARGLLLVTSTPPGLVVEVDAHRMDLTPARIGIEAGRHVVVLSRGDVRLYERSVQLDADEVISVDADLTERLRPPSAFEPPEAKPAPVALPTESTRPVDPPPAPGLSPRDDTLPMPDEPDAPPGKTGELHVLSLTVYGEVWINDRPYGFPPLVAKDLPAGQAKVEIRVGGVARRTKTAEVIASRRGTLRIR